MLVIPSRGLNACEFVDKLIGWIDQLKDEGVPSTVALDYRGMRPVPIGVVRAALHILKGLGVSDVIVLVDSPDECASKLGSQLGYRAEVDPVMGFVVCKTGE